MKRTIGIAVLALALSCRAVSGAAAEFAFDFAGQGAAEGAVTLVVSAEPGDWITDASAQLLRVRAAEELPLPADAAALLPRESVGVSTNGDGTATLAVPRAADVPRSYYRVEAPDCSWSGVFSRKERKGRKEGRV